MCSQKLVVEFNFYLGDSYSRFGIAGSTTELNSNIITHKIRLQAVILFFEKNTG